MVSFKDLFHVKITSLIISNSILFLPTIHYSLESFFPSDHLILQRLYIIQLKNIEKKNYPFSSPKTPHFVISTTKNRKHDSFITNDTHTHLDSWMIINRFHNVVYTSHNKNERHCRLS